MLQLGTLASCLATLRPLPHRIVHRPYRPARQIKACPRRGLEPPLAAWSLPLVLYGSSPLASSPLWVFPATYRRRAQSEVRATRHPTDKTVYALPPLLPRRRIDIHYARHAPRAARRLSLLVTEVVAPEPSAHVELASANTADRMASPGGGHAPCPSCSPRSST